MGNRGVLHDDTGRIVRNSQVRRWITCEVEFRGRRREVMAPGRYTELFFLDEAVAFAAGHRPCAECRHGDYREFRRLWPGTGRRADEIDRELARERGRATETVDPPAGAFVALDDECWLVTGDRLARWTPSGYADRLPVPSSAVAMLTPPSTAAVLAAGYRPRLHPTSA
ncbi:hypothetical protein CLV40_117112 [Actinokineospora auranticolor]|uniref:Metal binding Ada-like protein n=2 Tax=Actinokineospora auranticolor TaxID=155976 RepID=A0A2S6GI57_9PSEU|nr:hypothetical protein CLV40_117112 [Actinokineospora auranticolor]